MAALNEPTENSAGWRRLWDLIAARIVEQDSLVQEADENETEVNDHESICCNE